MVSRRRILRAGACVGCAVGLSMGAGCLSEDAGESGDDGTGPSDEEDDRDLGIDHVRFVDGEPTGYRSYTEIEDRSYGIDVESVWLYFEPTGVSVGNGNDEDGPAYEIRAVVTMTDPDGEQRRSQRDELEGDEMDDPYVAIEYPVRRPTLGEYSLEIELLDQNTGNRATETVTFAIEDEQLELRDEFREHVEAETDVDVDRLVIDDGALRFTYHSSYSADDGDLYEEVGAIVIERGLAVDSLRATGFDSEDERFTYHVETEKARAWNEGEITDQEYSDHVHDQIRFSR